MGNIRDEISNELRKNWPIFVIHQNREFIFSEIELLKDFNSEQESLLETQLNNFNLRVDDQLKNLDEDSKNMVSENYSDEYWKFKEIFPNLYRCSHFITCFSFFEYHLTELCKILKNLFDNDILLDLSDLKGKNDIDRIKKYLKKVIRINFPDQSIFWKNILIFKKIRNAIVHKNGNINKLGSNEFNSVKSFIDDNRNLLSYDEYYKVKLSEEFIIDFLNTIISFIEEIYMACDVWVRDIAKKLS